MPFLDKIIAAKRLEVREAKSRRPESALLREIPPGRRTFGAPLRQERLSVIAEVKRRSPAKGPLAPDLDLAPLVRAYEAGGAAAVSILTDSEFFGGSLSDLALARQATTLPLLRKDFLIDPYQIIEAAWAGADAALLIAACLSPGQLGELAAVARELGLATLLEVHSAAEMDLAAGIDATAIGINNRDLKTFAIRLETAEELAPLACGRLLVAESGINGPEDARRMARAGADAVLVGEALVRSQDPAATLTELRVMKR